MVITRRFNPCTFLTLLLSILLLVWSGAHLYAQDSTPTPSGSYVSAESVFVRAGPGEAFPAAGSLTRDMLLAPIGRDASGEWVAIRFRTGTAWIRRDLAVWNVNVDGLPVLDPQTLLSTPDASRTPFILPTATPQGSWVNVGEQGAFVRVGPGLTYSPVTIVNSGTIVQPVGRTPETDWILIRVGDGFGWIARLLVRWDIDLRTLPVLLRSNLTPTATFTQTTTPSPTATATSTATATQTFTSTPTATLTASPTITQTASATLTLTPTSTATPTATGTATPVPSSTPTETAAATFTPQPSLTVVPTVTPLPTFTPTLLPTDTPAATATTVIAQVLPTDAPSATPTWTPTPTPTASPTLMPSATATTVPSAVPTVIAAVVLPTETLFPATSTVVVATPTLPSSPTPTASTTPAPILVSTPVLTDAAPTAETGGQNPPVELFVGIVGLLALGGYAALYWRGLIAQDRYKNGFVIKQCPVCQQGNLLVETRRERVLGIPRPRHTVHCSHCRSLLRESGPRQWRYAVDKLDNPQLHATLNGRILDEDTLRQIAQQAQVNPVTLAPRPPSTPPRFVDDDRG